MTPAERLVEPARKAMYSSFAGRYDNPMPELAFLSPVRDYEFDYRLKTVLIMKRIKPTFLYLYTVKKG